MCGRYFCGLLCWVVLCGVVSGQETSPAGGQIKVAVAARQYDKAVADTVSICQARKGQSGVAEPLSAEVYELQGYGRYAEAKQAYLA